MTSWRESTERAWSIVSIYPAAWTLGDRAGLADLFGEGNRACVAVGSYGVDRVGLRFRTHLADHFCLSTDAELADQLE